MMTHATLELNENPKNKAKYVHGSLKLNIIFIDSVEGFLVLPPIMPPQQDWKSAKVGQISEPAWFDFRSSFLNA